MMLWKEGGPDGFSFRLYGRKRTDAIGTNICVKCGQPKGRFRDEVSEKEYTISGLCQVCQDSIFEEEENVMEDEITPRFGPFSW